MTKLLLQLAAASAITAAAASAHAVVVFESFANFATAGTPDTGEFCSSCTGYGVLAASFTLTAAQTLDKAFVLIKPLADPQNNSLTVSIIPDNGNDLPLGGDSSFVLLHYLDYTLPTSLTPEPGNNLLAEMALPNWELAAGKYWIRFAGYAMTMPVFTTTTPEVSRVVGGQFFNGNGITFNPPNAAIGFSLNAVTAPVPEPGSLALMLAGIASLGFIARRGLGADAARPPGGRC